MKKIFVIFISIALSLALSISSFAVRDNEPTPFANDVCNGYTYHYMKQAGNCYVVNSSGGIIANFWSLYNCERCGIYIACDGNPDSTGTYGTWGYIGDMYDGVIVEGTLIENSRVKATTPKITVNGVPDHYRFKYPYGAR